MSWRHIEAIASLPDDIASEAVTRCVLLALAHHANDFTNRCYPGAERISSLTGLSESSVRRGIAALKAAQLVHIDERPGRPNLYTLLLPLAEPVDGHKRARKQTHVSQTGVSDRQATHVPQTGEGCLPDTRKRIERERKSDARAGLADDWMPSREVVSWCDSTFPTVDHNHQRLLFIASSQAKQIVHRDPDAAFKAWMLRTTDLKTEPKQRSAPTPAHPERVPGLDAPLLEQKARDLTDPMERARHYLMAAQSHEKDGNLDEARRCAQLAADLRRGDFIGHAATALIARCLSAAADPDGT